MMQELNTILTFESYFQQFPNDVQEILHKIRQIIQEAAPDAAEKISYQMPTFYSIAFVFAYGRQFYISVQTHTLGRKYLCYSGLKLFCV